MWEKKFTQGPWRIDSKRTQYHIKGNPSPLITVHKNQINAEANANLIAAAPELLKALETMSALLGGIIKDVLNDNFCSVKLLASAAKTEIVSGNTVLKIPAIKKAYGETK